MARVTYTQNFADGIEAGKKAFHAGKHAIPAHDIETINYLKVIKTDSVLKAYNRYLEGWHRGWHTENVRAPV